MRPGGGVRGEKGGMRREGGEIQGQGDSGREENESDERYGGPARNKVHGGRVEKGVTVHGDSGRQK